MTRFPLGLAGWLKSYNRDNLSGDLNAGFTVGVMLIPQGLAYALIAGLPPIYGLYAALIPLIVYAMFGSSGQLAVGPVAMVSLLVAAGVGHLAEGGTEQYIQLAIMLALIVGVIQLVLGLLKFGFITNFLSHPVLSGFTSAAALIIGMAQLKHLIGIPIPGDQNVFQMGYYAVSHLAEINGVTFAIGLGGIALILAVKKVNPRIPGGLIAVALATVLVYAAGLDASGVAIVCSVPAGLPMPSVSFIDLTSVKALLPTALAIALVGYMESIAVAKAFASKHRYTIDPSRELVALGLANIAGSFFRAFPTTGGFSRSAVNHQAGSKTGLSSVVSALVVGLTLLLFTPLFTFLPKALLASIVIVAVAGLIDLAEVTYLWKVNKTDLFLLVATFFCTLFLGIEEGILIGVGLSLLSFVQQASQPHMAQLGKLPGQEIFKNLNRYPDAEVTPGVVIFRVDASLFFGNVEVVKDALNEVLLRPEAISTLILDLYPVNRIDSSALHALSDLHRNLKEKQIQLLFSGVKGPVLDAMNRSGLADQVGRDHFYNRIFDASESSKGGQNAYLEAPAS